MVSVSECSIRGIYGVELDFESPCLVMEKIRESMGVLSQPWNHMERLVYGGRLVRKEFKNREGTFIWEQSSRDWHPIWSRWGWLGDLCKVLIVF